LKFRRQKRMELAVNLTPLIDVVFLLLIFFMVSTSFSNRTEVAVELPEAEGRAVSMDESVLELRIDAQGQYSLNGEPIPPRALAVRGALRAAAAGREQVPLTIAADGEAPHRTVVLAIDAANSLGFDQLTIATQQPATGAYLGEQGIDPDV